MCKYEERNSGNGAPRAEARGTQKYSASPEYFHVQASQQLSASKISFAVGRNRAEAESFSHSSPDFSPGSSAKADK